MRPLSHLVLVPLLAAVITISLGLPLSLACNGSLPEDLNGDGKVDMLDIRIVGDAFGSYPGHPRWNPIADIIADEKIDMLDLLKVAQKIGDDPPKLPITVEIHPVSLNLMSQGRWITVYTSLPENYSISNIDISTLKLNDTVSPESRPMSFLNNTMMMKFDRAVVEAYILNATDSSGRFVEVALTVSGKLEDGTEFIGTDLITAIVQG